MTDELWPERVTVEDIIRNLHDDSRYPPQLCAGELCDKPAIFSVFYGVLVFGHKYTSLEFLDAVGFMADNGTLYNSGIPLCSRHLATLYDLNLPIAGYLDRTGVAEFFCVLSSHYAPRRKTK